MNINKENKFTKVQNNIWVSFKKFLLDFFVIPVPIILFLAFTALPFVGYCLYNNNLDMHIRLISYVLSAYTLIVLCIRIPYMYRCTKELVKGDSIYLIVFLRKIMRKFKYTRMYLEEIEFRATVALYLGFCINTLYSGIRFYGGIKNKSIWFAAIGIYYFIFGIIRFFLIKQIRISKNIKDIKKERLYSLRTYRFCGILMLILNITMAGMMAQMITKNQSIRDYTINEIYYTALYTFYSAYISIYNMIKFRKDKNEILSASKKLSFVGTLMSIFTLQTSMLLIFNNGQTNMQIMNIITGSIIIIFTILTSIFMIVRANYKLKLFENFKELN